MCSCYGEQNIGEQEAPVPSIIVHYLPQHHFQGLVELLHEPIFLEVLYGDPYLLELQQLAHISY